MNYSLRVLSTEQKALVSQFSKLATILLLAAFSVGCATTDNTHGTRTFEQDPTRRGVVSGVGIEGQDIIAMTDRMMRDMLSVPALVDRDEPPRVIIDSEYFVNESSQRLNKNSITNRLRTELTRASRGRMVFVGRHYSDMVAKERELKRSGVVDVGTTGLTKAQAGGDFRLGGSITSQDTRQSGAGLIQRYNWINFELLDVETGIIVWSNIYELSRAASDDVVYR